MSSLLLALIFALSGSVSAGAACVIPSSPCYPWRIEENADDTAILEIIPNNALSGMIYRVCVCAPAKGVSVVFDFVDKAVVLGALELSGESPVCRDFRIETTRKSRLLVRRLGDAGRTVEGSTRLRERGRGAWAAPMRLVRPFDARDG